MTRAQRIVAAAEAAYQAHLTQNVAAGEAGDTAEQVLERAIAEEHARDASLEALWEAVRGASAPKKG
jgi:hypothetical protein